MKISCGTDIIEIERIKNSIENIGDIFLNKIYTPNEIQYCKSKNKSKYQHFAARFAAKEAVFKALNSILTNKYSVTWKNIEIINDKKGKPYINFIDISFSNILSIDISISHCKEYAVANVVMLYEEGRYYNEII